MVTHARELLPIKLLKKSFPPHGMKKLCSKFGEDWSTNDVTILSTDARDRTSDMSVILYSALHWTDNEAN